MPDSDLNGSWGAAAHVDRLWTEQRAIAVRPTPIARRPRGGSYFPAGTGDGTTRMYGLGSSHPSG